MELSLPISLQCHTDTPAKSVSGVSVKTFERFETGITLTYTVNGDVLWPRVEPQDRKNSLWKSTCFELFIQVPGEQGYCEYNFAPSTAWAAYGFDGYRDGMHHLNLEGGPEIMVRGQALTARVPVLPRLFALPWLVSLTTVIEERDGRVSYWAVDHAKGEPDFHHRDCFALSIAPPGLA